MPWLLQTKYRLGENGEYVGSFDSPPAPTTAIYPLVLQIDTVTRKIRPGSPGPSRFQQEMNTETTGSLGLTKGDSESRWLDEFVQLAMQTLSEFDEK